ncbi:MAG TPA: hypothetical protein VHU81_00005, partial [Thermoanaerobaculia bacterium]|nr:hypothetical protein [Thermoanaerobaculia bacterium]
MLHRSVILSALLCLVGAVFGPGQAAAQPAPASLDFLDEFGRVTDHYIPRETVHLRVTAAERNDPLQKDSFPVRLTAGGDSEDLIVQETGFDTGVFVGEMGTHPYYGTSSFDGTLTTNLGTQIQASYFQLYQPDPLVAVATVRRGVALFVDTQGRPAEVYLEGSRAYVRVKDRSIAFDDIRIDHTQVQVSAAISGDVETVALTETGEDTGVLEGSIQLRLDFAQPGDGVLQTRETIGPPAAFDTLTVSYNSPDGPVTASVGLIGSRLWFIDAFGNLADRYAAGSAVYIRLEDQNPNRPGQFDQAQVRVINLQNGDEEVFNLWETTKNSGIYEGSLPIDDNPSSSISDSRLQAMAGDAIEVRHSEGMGFTESTDQAQIASHSVSFIDDAGRATDELLESGTARIRVFSRADNLNPGIAEQLTATVESLYGGGDHEPVQLTETGPDTSVFEGSLRLTVGSYVPGDNKLMTANSGPPEYRADQVTATYGLESAVAHTIGARVYFLDAYGRVTDHYVPREAVRVRVVDQNRNDPFQKDSFPVRLNSGGDSEDVYVQETGFDTGVFEGSIGTHEYYGTSSNDGTLTTYVGSQIQATHFQLYLPDPVVATATVRGGVLLFVDAQGRPAETYLEGSRAYVRVMDRTVAFDDIRTDTLQVQISAGVSGDVETLTLTETGVETGVLEGSIPLRLDFAHPGNGALETRENPGPPHEFDTLTASYNRPGGPVSASITLTGSRTLFIDAFGNPAEAYASGSRAYVQVEDQNANRAGLFDQVLVVLRSVSGSDEELLYLQETTKDSGIFEGSMALDDSSPPSSGDGRLQVLPGELIDAIHNDGIGLTASGDRARIDNLSVTFIDEAGKATGELLESGTGRVRVFSRGDNVNAGTVDQLSITVRSLYGADQEQVQLTETGASTSVFEGSFRLTVNPSNPGDDKLKTSNGGPPAYLADQVTASYGPYSAVAHMVGARVYFLDAYGRVTDHYVPREDIRLRVVDQNRNDPFQKDSFPVRLNSGGDSEDVYVQETGFNSGVFEGSIGSHEYYGTSSNDGTLTTYAGAQIQATHFQLYLPDPVIATATVRGGALLFVDAQGRPAETYLEGSRAYVRVMDRTVAFDSIRIDSMQVQISAGISGDVETLTLTETGEDTGVLEGSIQLRLDFAHPGNGTLETRENPGPPHEFDTLTASYNRPTGTVSASIGLIGSRTWFIDAFGNPAETYAAGSRVYVRVEHQNSDRLNQLDHTSVFLRSLQGGDEELLDLQETSKDSGIFEGSMALDADSPVSTGDGRLQAFPGELIDAIHNDGIGLTASGDRAQIDSLSVIFIDEAGRVTDELLESGTGRVRVFSRGDNFNAGSIDQVSVTVRSLYGADQEPVQLTETGANTSVFEGSFRLTVNPSNPGDNKLK